MHIRHDFGVGLESSASSIAANIRIISSCVYTYGVYVLDGLLGRRGHNIQYPDGTDTSETELILYFDNSVYHESW